MNIRNPRQLEQLRKEISIKNDIIRVMKRDGRDEVTLAYIEIETNAVKIMIDEFRVTEYLLESKDSTIRDAVKRMTWG
jgi:hypothetical protein